MQLSGPGVSLPYMGSKNFPNSGAQGLRAGLAIELSSDSFALPAGGMIQIPPGNYYGRLGTYSSLQYLSSITNTWRTVSREASGPSFYINSDGTNYRIVNPLGTPVGALVTANGSGYTQATTNVSVSAGGSTWLPIIGGAITAISVGNDSGGTAGGTNWTYPPIVVIDAPPSYQSNGVGGVAATAYAAISAGAVSAITMVDNGAGYTQGAPTVNLYPNPLDPNYGSITIPACTPTVGGAGELTAVLPIAPGTVRTSAPNLTINSTGAGSSATATAIMALTITAVTVSGGSSGTPVSGVGGLVTTAAATINSPSVSTNIFIPRNCNIYESGASTGVIIDGGLFQVAPTSSAGTATFTMGSTYDVIQLQLVPGT